MCAGCGNVVDYEEYERARYGGLVVPKFVEVEEPEPAEDWILKWGVLCRCTNEGCWSPNLNGGVCVVCLRPSLSPILFFAVENEFLSLLLE